jgi:uncharacterized protein with HEPN domain
MTKASLRDRLLHIERSISASEGYWQGKTFTDFQSSEPFRAATERHLLIISEAVRYIPENAQHAYPQNSVAGNSWHRQYFAARL